MKHNPSPYHQLLSKEQAASYLGISLSTLNRYIILDILKPIRIGRTVRFNKEVLDEQLSSAYKSLTTKQD